MPFSELMNDNVSLVKKSGERVDNIQASVQVKNIFIDRSDILIETGDLIQRKMSNGAEETYEIIDPGFHEGLFDIPAGYQMTHKKLGLPEAKKAVQNITYNNSINIHGDNHGSTIAGNNNTINNSEFNQKFTQLTQEIQRSNIENKNQIIQELNERKEDKIELQAYLIKLLPITADIATIVSVIGGLLGMLG